MKSKTQNSEKRKKYDVTADVDGKVIHLGVVKYSELKRLENSKGLKIVSCRVLEKQRVRKKKVKKYLFIK